MRNRRVRGFFDEDGYFFYIVSVNGVTYSLSWRAWPQHKTSADWDLIWGMFHA